MTDGDGRRAGTGWVANVRALNAIRSGDLAGAVETLEAAREGAHPLERISIENSLGIVRAEEGDLDGALAWFEHLLVLADDTGALDAAAVATGAVAEIWHRSGDLDRAMAATATVLDLAGQSGMRAQHAMGVVGAARLMADHGDHDEAVTLHAGADRVLAETGQNLFPADRELSDRMHEAARDTLTAAAFDEAQEAGRALSELDLHERSVGALRAAIAGRATTASS